MLAGAEHGTAGGVTSDVRYQRIALYVSWSLAILTLILSVIVTVGWAIDSDALKSIFADGQPVWCSTAIDMILTMVALLAFNLPHTFAALNPYKKPLYILATLLCSIVLLSGLATAVETMGGLDLGLNQTWYQSSVESAGVTYPGPMSPDVSIAFVIVSVALIAQGWLSDSTKDKCQWVYLVAMMVTSLPLFGMLTGAKALCTFFGCLRMSPTVSFVFVLMCMACFISRSKSGPAAILVADTASGKVARRASLLLLLLPALLAMRQFISAAHLVDEPLSWAVFGVGATALVIGIVISAVRAAESVSTSGNSTQVREPAQLSLTAASGTAVNLFAQAIDAHVISGSKGPSQSSGQLKDKNTGKGTGSVQSALDGASEGDRVSVKSIDNLIARQPAQEMQSALAKPPSNQDRIKKICLECDREFSRDELYCPDCKIALARVVNKSLVGEVFADKYEIIWSIGEGAMARVYKARHKYLNQMVALKVLNAAVSSTTVGIKRFQQEAKALAAVDHPNIVAVQDFGFSASGEAFLAMEYASGRSLADYLSESKTLDPRDTAAIVSQLCDALEHAHGKGIVHRDLKPSNIMCRKLNNGEWLVKVVDFGLAKMIDDENGESALKLTQTGECHGSPPYMSPEQCMGKSVDYRTDIYALGCIIYECVTGYPPFYSGSVYDILTHHVKTPPPKPVSQFKLSTVLTMLLYRALQKEPELRFNNVAEIKQIILSLKPTESYI